MENLNLKNELKQKDEFIQELQMKNGDLEKQNLKGKFDFGSLSCHS